MDDRSTNDRSAVSADRDNPYAAPRADDAGSTHSALGENPPGAVPALVFGILATVFCVMSIFAVLGLVFGILAIVYAIRAKRLAREDPARYIPGGIRIGGLVCGIVGLCISSLVVMFFLAAIGFAFFALSGTR